MKTVICKKYAGKLLTTAHGVIQFDGNGLVELEDAAADKLATIPGFSIYAAENGDGEQGDKEHSGDSEHAESDKKGSQEDENGSNLNKGDTSDEDEPGEPGEQGDDTSKDDSEDAIDELDIEALKKLTVPALKSLAKKRGLNIEGLSKKDEFITLLTSTPAAE